MKVPVRAIGRPYRGNAVGATFNVSRGASRILLAQNRVELVDAATPAEAKNATQAVSKPVAKRAAAKKAPAKKAPAKKAAARKTATKSVRGTQNRSMAGKTSTKAD
jgi:hypothetical protein